MSLVKNDLYSKISWIYEVPDFFEDQLISEKRLYSFHKDDQNFLVIKLLNTLTQYFGHIPGSPDGLTLLDINSEKFKNSLENICVVWLNGLCDLSIKMIVEGLLDILNLKTEYQKWPPKSVMEFYAVCKKFRPAYHEIKVSDNYKKITNEKSELIATNTLSYLYKIRNRCYEQHTRKIIRVLENKKRTDNEQREYENRKLVLDILERQKNANI